MGAEPAEVNMSAPKIRDTLEGIPRCRARTSPIFESWYGALASRLGWVNRAIRAVRDGSGLTPSPQDGSRGVKHRDFARFERTHGGFRPRLNPPYKSAMTASSPVYVRPRKDCGRAANRR